MVVSISKVQVTTMVTTANVNVCHNHAIMYDPYDNSDPNTFKSNYITYT